MIINPYIIKFAEYFPELIHLTPWEFCRMIESHLGSFISTLDPMEYRISDSIAIHKTAVIEQHVILKGPVIICAHTFVGAHAYLRNGVFLGKHVSVGPGCEIKSSAIFDYTAIAHFNFVGDSLIGSHVNLEAGSVLTNYHNDRDDKSINVKVDETIIRTGVEKFGALIGDHSKIGANAVCSPGTLLQPYSIVKRLELVDQLRKEK
jgi:UDP-N-acetylglucosamine diphosphorylase / glucose-1-phosphate thymidylyltransferase / UDP-N-acetylgalactosamine diphosphorylase / glucosamine-1-phosphate N-acetyltransferase / galactosamine-1-phosphate N-acetyltransferase